MAETAWDELRKIVAERLEVDPTTLERETHLVLDLAVDPLTLLELVMAAERAFSVRLRDSEVADLVTLDDLLRCVESRELAESHGQRSAPA